MDIPAHICILATIQTGSVYYFEEEQLRSTESHYFILLNKDPCREEFLILVVASSQVAKRKQTIQKLGFPQETLVFVSPSEYPLFVKDTVIDCNRAFEKSSQSLIEKLEEGKLKVCKEIMPENVVGKLRQGVLVSPQISGRVRRMLASSSNDRGRNSPEGDSLL